MIGQKKVKMISETKELMDEFHGHMGDIMQDVDMSVKVAMSAIKNPNQGSLNDSIVKSLKNNSIDLKKLFENYLEHEISTLAILPSSYYLLENLKLFKTCFDQIILCDSYKKGWCIDGIEIIGPDELDKVIPEIDAFLIPTGNSAVQKIYEELIPAHKTISFMEFSSLLFQNEPIRKEIRCLPDKLQKIDKPFIALNGCYYRTGYTPIYSTLQKQGYEVIILSLSSVAVHAGFSTNLDEAVPFAKHYEISFEEMLYLLREMKRGVLWVVEETFLSHNWDFELCVACYAYSASILRMAKIPTILNMYDICRLATQKHEFEKDFISVYKNTLLSADSLILNSNTRDAVDFLKNVLHIQKPVTSFVRYNFYAEKLCEKIEDGFHIAIVGMFLNEGGDPIRADMRRYIKMLLSDGIHLHYYSDSLEIHKFCDILDDREKSFFHIHPSILDQHELMYDISRYDAGWMVHNTQAFVDIMASVSSPFLKDLIFTFQNTTVPSCVSLFANAGLPMFVNRSMHGLLQEFPREFFIPIELSEISQIKRIIQDFDWEGVSTKVLDKRSLFSVEQNIQKLTDFIDSISTSQ